jgi:hypothetical protein
VRSSGESSTYRSFGSGATGIGGGLVARRPEGATVNRRWWEETYGGWQRGRRVGQPFFYKMNGLW